MSRTHLAALATIGSREVLPRASGYVSLVPPPDRPPASTVTFGGLEIAYDERVLRPREWTIAQSTWAADLLAEAAGGPVLELFAGVGHIGLAAVTGTDRALVLVDLNPAACELARRNVREASHGAPVEVREGRIDDVLGPDEMFPLVIADPPWVPTAGTAAFPDDPGIAIDGGADGLDLARTTCEVIDRHLQAGGSAILQLGSTEQVDAIAEHLDRHLDSDLQLGEVRLFERGVLAHLFR